jgi:integrase
MPEDCVQAAYSKRRREDTLPLRPELAEALREHLAPGLPDATAFDMPLPNRVAMMLRADLADAGIPYRDEMGRVCDFHGLRHTTGSLLATAGVHPKAAQGLMRHSTIALTMDRYTHLLRGSDRDAAAALPDLAPAARPHALRATGTDDAHGAADHDVSQSG